MLYREPMWLKFAIFVSGTTAVPVSVLYREPMWLKLLWPQFAHFRILFQCSTVSRCG